MGTTPPAGGRNLLGDDVLIRFARGDHGQDVLGVGCHDVENVDTFGIEQPLECGQEVFLVDDAFAGNAETFAEFHVVRINARGILRIAEEGVSAVAVVKTVLPLHHHAEVLVVEDDGLGRDFFDVGAGQFLHVHEERTVAVDVDDFDVGAGDFGAHGGGITEAHGAEPGGRDESARFLEIVKLPGPHLVLSDTGGEDGFAFGQFVELLDDVLRLDGVVGVFVAERLLFFPRRDFVIPGLEPREFGAGDAFEAFLGQEFVGALERVFHVAEDGQRDDFVFVQLGIVDVDVDDGPVLGEFFHLAGHAVVETHADGEKQVGFVHRIVGIDAAVHAEPFERKRMRLGEAADAHERGGHGDLGALDKFEQLGCGVGRDDAAAAINHRIARLLDQADHFEQLLVGRALVRIVTPERDGLGEDRLDFLVLDVFRKVDDHRARAAGGGDVESFFDDARDLVDVPDEVAVFDDRQGHAEEIGFLERAASDHVLRHLTGDGDDRHGIHERVGQAGDQVGRAGSGSGHTEADFAGGTGVALGGKHPALLMARKDGADLFRTRKGLVDGHARPAGIGENGVGPLEFEAADKDLRAVHQLGVLLC